MSIIPIFRPPIMLVTAIKYSSNGTVLWTTQPPFGGMGLPFVKDGKVDGVGNLYVVYNMINNTPFDTLAFASAGGVLWGAGNPTGDTFSLVNALALDSSNSVFVTGRNSYYYPNSSYGTYKIATNGAYVLTNNCPNVPTTTNVATAITVDRWNNAYVTGYSQGTNSGMDIVTIKYYNNGNQIWLERYNGPGNDDDEANAIALDGSGNVYVTGFEAVPGGGTEMVLIKYSPVNPGVRKQTNGSMQLHATGLPGQTFDFQASTNFLSWLDLGTTNADTNGCVLFTDTNAPFFPYRFYLTTPE